MTPRFAAFCTAFLSLSQPVAATGASNGGTTIRLPSGGELIWLETLHDNAGGAGLTYRFRFLMKDLAARVPSTTGPASEPGMEERAPIEIDTETGEGGEDDGGDDGEYFDDGLIDPSTLDLSPVEADDSAEQEADAMIGEPALPAAPDVLAQDPLHDDLVWLCDNWIMSRIASPGPRPRIVIVSIADKDIPFGAYDPEVLQLFEAFELPPGSAHCEWEPW